MWAWEPSSATLFTRESEAGDRFKACLVNLDFCLQKSSVLKGLEMELFGRELA